MAVLTVIRRTHPSKLLNSVNLPKFLNTFATLLRDVGGLLLPSEYLNAVANTLPATFCKDVFGHPLFRDAPFQQVFQFVVHLVRKRRVVQ